MTILPRRLFGRRDGREDVLRLRHALESAPGGGPGRCFFIVVPRTLHLLEPAVGCLKDVPCALILNGLSSWETDHLRARFPNIPAIALTARRPLLHGDVLDLLLDAASDPFVIVDHDCYVLDPTILNCLIPGAGETMAGPFRIVNQQLGLVFPRTYLLGIDPRPVNEIRAEHRVGCAWRRRPPRHVRKIVEETLRPCRYPVPQHTFFDTLYIIHLVATGKGLRFREVDAEPGAVIHVGRTSYHQSVRTTHPETLIAHYFHLRMLEQSFSVELTRRYGPVFRDYGASAELLRRFPGLLTVPAKLEIDHLLAELERRQLLGSPVT